MRKTDSFVQPMYIAGKKFEPKFTQIEVSNLSLDPDNVRFDHIGKNLPQNKIEEYIWDEEDAKTLYVQIKKDGHLIEPIVVIPKDGRYLVKEGNRRTVCIKRLQRDVHAGKLKGFKKDHFDSAPALVMPAETEPKYMRIYLGTRHVSGPRAWAALNKASHIYGMYHNDDLSFDEIRDLFGMGKNKVIELCKAFDATIRYSERKRNDNAWLHRYSFFAELFRSKPLKKWLDEDPANLDNFIDWVFEGKFPMAIDVRKLAKIVETAPELRNKALAILNSKNAIITDAFNVLGEKEPELTSAIFKEVKKTIGALRKLPYDEFEELIRDPARQALLEQLRDQVATVLEKAQDRKANGRARK